LSILNRKHAALTAAILIVLIVLSIFLAVNWSGNKASGRQFYVGIEYAYGANQTVQAQVAQIHALVDKVKDYTNLFVMGSVGLTFNQTALTQACDYIFNAKLNFIVLFTGLDLYNYSITQWMVDAKAKYGEQFLGIDRYDEPGGNQLDNGTFQLINDTTSYTQTATNYVANLTAFPDYYSQFAPKVFTADYGLFWFDYDSHYNAIFAEFVGNQSRQRIIALDRGAAQAFNKDWGVIVTWKYQDQPPYLESGNELYADLSLAYSSGAKYAVVFSYPNITAYGTLTDEHFATLQKFWTALQNDPGSFDSNKAEVAYIVPADYGFGFRNPNDTIWGLFPADNQSAKIYSDVKTLTTAYGSRFDLLYDEPQIIAPLLGSYSQVFYWNQTIP
jgi:hypothetical protein